MAQIQCNGNPIDVDTDYSLDVDGHAYVSGVTVKIGKTKKDGTLIYQTNKLTLQKLTRVKWFFTVFVCPLPPPPTPPLSVSAACMRVCKIRFHMFVHMCKCGHMCVCACLRLAIYQSTCSTSTKEISRSVSGVGAIPEVKDPSQKTASWVTTTKPSRRGSLPTVTWPSPTTSSTHATLTAPLEEPCWRSHALTQISVRGPTLAACAVRHVCLSVWVHVTRLTALCGNNQATLTHSKAVLSILCKRRVETALQAAAIAFGVKDGECKSATRIGNPERTERKDWFKGL